MRSLYSGSGATDQVAEGRPLKVEGYAMGAMIEVLERKPTMGFRGTET